MQNSPVRSYQCPKCGSEDTSSLRVAQSKGIRHIAPPVADSFEIVDYLLVGVIAVGAFTIGGFLIGFFSALIFDKRLWLPLIVTLFVTILLPAYYIERRRNRIEKRAIVFQGDIKAWQNTWICGRCAGTWLIKSR